MKLLIVLFLTLVLKANGNIEKFYTLPEEILFDLHEKPIDTIANSLGFRVFISPSFSKAKYCIHGYVKVDQTLDFGSIIVLKLESNAITKKEISLTEHQSRTIIRWFEDLSIPEKYRFGRITNNSVLDGTELLVKGQKNGVLFNLTMNNGENEKIERFCERFENLILWAK